MSNNFNHQKGRLDSKVLRENKDVREAHEAWTAVIHDHQSKYYGQRYITQTRNSISKRASNFFPVWLEWSPATKMLYDESIARVPFTHGIPQ